MIIDEAVLKINATTMFIVPLLKFNKAELIDSYGFKSAYIEDSYKEEQYERAIYMVFKPKFINKFNDFVEEERDRIIDEYDYPGGYIVLVYQWDEKWKKDIELILKGKFSKTSKAFKREIPEFVLIKGVGFPKQKLSTQHMIFQKSELIKKYWQDLYDIEFEEEDEIWQFKTENEILTQEQLV